MQRNKQDCKNLSKHIVWNDRIERKFKTMNTIRMFDEAEKLTLPRYKITANCLWALVSQAGRGFMSVGQVARMVNLTTGYKPSTYQVKEIMREFRDMGIIDTAVGPTRGKGTESVYAALPESIAALALYSYALDNEEVKKAASELTHDIWWLSRQKFAELKKYNEQLESES